MDDAYNPSPGYSRLPQLWKLWFRRNDGKSSVGNPREPPNYNRGEIRDGKGFWDGVRWDGKTASFFALWKTDERKAREKLVEHK
jgi:hypothetical protein